MTYQLVIPFEVQRRAEERLSRAVAHAESDTSGWKDMTYKIFVDEFLPLYPEFRVEQFRSFLAMKEDYVFPPHNRAFGFLSKRAVKDGLIVSAGIVTVSNPLAHSCYATKWRRVE